MGYDGPSSPAQRMYARKLGISVPSGIGASELHELITRAQKPDSQLLALADGLGLKYARDVSATVLQRLIDSDITRRQREQDASVALRVNGSITYEGETYKISSFTKFGGDQWYLLLIPSEGGQKRKVLLKLIVASLMR